MKLIINRLLLLVVSVFTVSVSWAHEIRPALLTIVQQDEQTYRMVFKQPQIQGRFLNLSVLTNCDSTLEKTKTSSTALEEAFNMICTDPLATVEVVGLDKTLIDTMITIEDLTHKKQNYLVTGREPKVNTVDGSSTPVYVVLGIEHLIFGIDHLLFVLLLFYLVSGWSNLFKVVTSFTVAHSITLGLSALNIATVSQAPVEALIALSIVLLAAEALHKRESLIYQKPWLITFVFGLLHGFGFAGALSNIGLPESSAITALFLFNLGIEVAQLFIISLLLALTFLFKQSGLKVAQKAFGIPVYMIGGVSFYWTIDRTLQVLIS